MTVCKPVLVGQGPSRGGAGKPPFSGRSGTVLAAAAGQTLSEFLEGVDAVNLFRRFRGKQLAGKGDLFPARAARRAARRLLPILRGRLVLAAGKAVARALGVARPEYFEERVTDGCLIVTIPHPSGINRWWNDPANRRAARRRLMGLLGTKKPGLQRPGSAAGKG